MSRQETKIYSITVYITDSTTAKYDVRYENRLRSIFSETNVPDDVKHFIENANIISRNNKGMIKQYRKRGIKYV